MNKKMHYIYKCLKRMNDEKFINHLLNYEYNPEEFYIQQFGMEYQSDVLYYIGTVAKNCGFFDQHHQLLELLYTADRFGFTPVVFYGKDFLYYEEQIKNCQNAFEYYFMPVGTDLFPKFRGAYNIIEAVSKHRVYAWNRDDLLIKYSTQMDQHRFGLYEQPDYSVYYGRMAEVQKKYISLNSGISKKMTTEIDELLGGKKLIGVHARGTDFRLGYKNCAKMINPVEHIAEVKKHIDSYDGMFLATDNVATIKLFKKQFGDMLLTYDDVYRSVDNKDGIHYSVDSRANHKFLLGYEVLRDMYTLASTDALIAGNSGVSSMARIQKKAFDREYDFVVILDNGRN